MTKTKILDLEEQIQKLQDKKTELEHKRNSEISTLIAKIGMNFIDEEILVGGLLYLKEQIQHNDTLKGEWLAAGRKFLKRK